MSAPHLLIDGDVIAFTAATVCQYVYHDGYGYTYPVAHRVEGEAVIDNLIHRLTQADWPGASFTVVLSDPTQNWRKGVWADYKANRKATVRPLVLDHMKDYLREKYGAFHWDTLEADDTLGIMLTAPAAFEYLREGQVMSDRLPLDADRILVGRDKDFLTVPGKYHRLKDYDYTGKPIVTESTVWMAKRWHMIQTLAGDAVDGYPGCKNLGVLRAAGVIDDPQFLRKEWGKITRGVNKGNSVPKWVAEPSRDYWAVIVSNYEKAGLTEEDALITARLAHILHWADYVDGKPVLWTPDKLKDLG